MGRVWALALGLILALFVCTALGAARRAEDAADGLCVRRRRRAASYLGGTNHMFARGIWLFVGVLFGAIGYVLGASIFPDTNIGLFFGGVVPITLTALATMWTKRQTDFLAGILGAGALTGVYAFQFNLDPQSLNYSLPVAMGQTHLPAPGLPRRDGGAVADEVRCPGGGRKDDRAASPLTRPPRLSRRGRWPHEPPHFRTALAGATALTLALAPTAAIANDDAPTEPMEVRGSSNSVGQSVQIRTDADGDPNSATVDFRWSVTQIGAQGDPGADITVAVPEEGLLLHNLQQFGMIPQEDGKGQFDISLNDTGFGTARSVSLVPPEDFELPVELTTEFTLDGEPILAQDLVGKDGVVTAKYTVINRTRETLTVPITSVTGDEIEKEVEADVPMVVEAVTLLPDRFSALNTGSGLGGADGRGNTQVKWIALPFAPLSKDGTSSFGWAANVTNAVIPSMLVQVLPVYIPPGEGGGRRAPPRRQRARPPSRLSLRRTSAAT